MREEHEGAGDAVDSLILIACATGSVAFDVDLGVLFCARPKLAATHLKTLEKLTLGTTSTDPRALRAQEFSRQLQKYVDGGGGGCSPVQACAAVLAYVEEHSIAAERARRFQSGEAIAHVSEAGALTRLLNFVDFLGGTRCALADPDLALAVIDADDGLQAVEDMAIRAHAASVDVRGANWPPDGGADERNAMSIVCGCAFRLLVANLALKKVGLKDSLGGATLERTRNLLNSVLERSHSSSFFGELGVEGREEIRDLALVAYDTAGESFFQNSSVMLEVVKDSLENRASASSMTMPRNGGIAIAVLRIFARPSVLLPLLLEKKEEVKSDLKNIVDVVHRIRFGEICKRRETVAPPCAGASSKNSTDACWNWSLCHSGSIQLSKGGCRVCKTQSSPDYSCAMSSEPFCVGAHSWEILFESTGSTWVGVADESTKNHLGTSPVIAYGVTLHNSGSWQLYGGLSATKKESAAFSNGSVVRTELDFDLGTLNMWVDGVHKLSIENIASKALHAYVCMDRTGECFELASATKQEATIQCQTVLDAVTLVSTSAIRLETGIYGNSVAKAWIHGYGQRIIDLFNSRLQVIAANIEQGADDEHVSLESLEDKSTKSCIEETFVLAQQICCSNFLAGELPSLSCMIQRIHALASRIELPSEHWLKVYLKMLVGALGPKIKTFIWGEPTDENIEVSNADWLKSPLFSKGLLASPSPLIQLMVPQDSEIRRVVSFPVSEQGGNLVGGTVTSGRSGLGVTDSENLTSLVGKRKCSEPRRERAEQSEWIIPGAGEAQRLQTWPEEGLVTQGAVIEKMIQPRIAVHLSPYLDLLERNVIIALLYHFGVLDTVLVSGAKQAEEIIHLCQVEIVNFCLFETPPLNHSETTALIVQDASFIARQVRKAVMENRSFANQSLRDGLAPKDWDFFVMPVVEKCILLLQVPPMCPPNTAMPTSTQRKLQTAAMLVKQGLAGLAQEEKSSERDKVVTAVQAHQVFKR